MAVTETTAETDGSLTAVTVSETETDCRPTDNARRSKRSQTASVTVRANFTLSAFRGNVSAETEFVPLHFGRSRN